MNNDTQQIWEAYAPHVIQEWNISTGNPSLLKVFSESTQGKYWLNYGLEQITNSVSQTLYNAGIITDDVQSRFDHNFLASPYGRPLFEEFCSARNKPQAQRLIADRESEIIAKYRVYLRNKSNS